MGYLNSDEADARMHAYHKHWHESKQNIDNQTMTLSAKQITVPNEMFQYSASWLRHESGSWLQQQSL